MTPDVAAPAAPETLRFLSRHANHELWLDPPRHEYDGNARQVNYIHGHKIQFVRGQYETSDPKEIAFLRQFLGGGVITEIPQDFPAAPAASVQVVTGLSTSPPVVPDTRIFCPFPNCPKRGPFRTPQALAMHMQTHLKKGAPAEGEAKDGE